MSVSQWKPSGRSDREARPPRAPRQERRPAGAGDSAGSPPRRLDRHGSLLGALAYGASQVVRARDACRSTPNTCTRIGTADGAMRRPILNALGYGGAHLKWLARRDAAALERELWASAAGAHACRRRHASTCRADKRTHARIRIEHLARCAPRRRRKSRWQQARRTAQVNVDRATCTLCMACVGACPESASARRTRAAAAQIHRAQLRAMRPVREHLPGRCDDAGRRGCCSARRRKAEQLLNEALAFPLRALRQAVRHQADDRQHAGQARRAFDVCRRRRSTDCRCAPTAASIDMMSQAGTTASAWGLENQDRAR